MIVYVHPRCSTCKKAMAFLGDKKVNLKDITKEAPSINELKTMLGYVGSIRKLFNTSGEVYREMGLKDKLDGLSEKEALELLAGNGMLVKRPFVLGRDFGMVGFNEKDWEKVK